MQHSCSHYIAIGNHRFKRRIERRTQTQPFIAEHRGGTDRVRNDPSRTRRTDEVPFIVGCSHFTRKNARFRAPASSPKQSPCNIHAAICDLQPQLQETHRTTHTDTTTHCRTKGRNRSRPERPQPHPPHRRGTFHRRLQPLYTEKHKVSFCSFLPETKPMQHSCSHYNAICNHSFKQRREPRTQTHNHSLQNTEEEPIASGTTPAAPAAQTRYLSSSAAATLHGKTQKVSCSGFLPEI